MYFLAIDTATNSGGVALSRNSEVLGVIMMKTPMKYSDRVIANIDFLLDQMGIGIDQVDCFVTSHGPGSFTGLRIGLATIKGLAQSLDKPVIGLSTLECLAWRFRHADKLISPMVDARRQQVYTGMYEVGNEGLVPLRPESVGSPSDWVKGITEPCAFVGDGAEMYFQTIKAFLPEHKVIRSDNVILTELCELSYRRFIKGEVLSAGELEANYIRPSDADQGPPKPSFS